MLGMSIKIPETMNGERRVLIGVGLCEKDRAETSRKALTRVNGDGQCR